MSADPGGPGRRHLERVSRASDAFFQREAEAVSRTCWAMARRFHRGGRLFALGAGARRSDAHHVSVEFVHPVLVGRRALPALALGADPRRELELLGRAQDIAVAFWDTGTGREQRVLEGLGHARERGMLTVGLTGGKGEERSPEGVDHLFVVREDDPTVVQEVHETLYHVLWELVHVFLDRRSLMEAAASEVAGPPSAPEVSRSCSVCGDEGEVGTVLGLTADPRVARVRLPSGEREVAVDFLDEVQPGDRIVVQLGFAIGSLDGCAGTEAEA